jgi:transposase
MIQIIKKNSYLEISALVSKVEESVLELIVLNSITVNYQSTLNYFDNRSTNASAESFNAKLKGSEVSLEGFRKPTFLVQII